MSNIKVTIKNRKTKEYPVGVSLYEICEDLNLQNQIVGAKINNELNPLTTRLIADTEVELIDYTDLAGYKMYQSGIKFIFEVALKELYPDLEVMYEHSVPRGILAEIVGDKVITDKDLVKVKGIMYKIIDDDLLFETYNISKKDAIRYYEEKKEYEKAQNIKDSNEDVIRLYKLKDVLNYFYNDMPYSTRSVSKFEMVYLGNNRLVFTIPSARSNGKVPEYVHHKNIINSFLDGKNWLEKMEIPYLADLNKLISSSNIDDIIESNELLFNSEIAKCAETIVKNSEKKIILIAGPSSSGKTTTTKRLSSYLKVRGLKPIMISVDDYFVDRSRTPKDENGDYDYECLMAINIEQRNNKIVQISIK